MSMRKRREFSLKISRARSCRTTNWRVYSPFRMCLCPRTKPFLLTKRLLKLPASPSRMYDVLPANRPFSRKPFSAHPVVVGAETNLLFKLKSEFEESSSLHGERALFPAEKCRPHRIHGRFPNL